MLQTLSETGANASELVQLRIEDVSLIERVVAIRQGKGSKRGVAPRRAVPLQPDGDLDRVARQRRHRRTLGVGDTFTRDVDPCSLRPRKCRRLHRG
jgi:integrase